MDQQQQQQQQQHLQQQQTAKSDPLNMPSAAVDFNGPYDSSSSSSVTANLSMPLVYPLIAEALANEGFPGFASMLASAPYQNQGQTMHTTSSGSELALQDPNNLMGDMQPLELMQYNSLVFDGHYLDALPYSVIQNGCGADGPGVDASGFSDSPQGFAFGSSAYFGDQFSQPMHIQPNQQQQQQQQPQQQSYQQGYFDASGSASGSSSAGSSSSSAGSSSSSGNFGFNMPSWPAGFLYSQGDYLMERKREGAAAHGMIQGPAGPVFSRGTHVQPPFESPEDSDDDDDDVEEYGEDDDEVPGMIPSDPQYANLQSGFPGDDAHVPPLAPPSRTAQQQQGQKHGRDDENQFGSSKRTRSDMSSGSSALPMSGQHRPTTGGAGLGHSRSSSMSSVHSHCSSASPPSSSGSSSSSSMNPKPARAQGETVEKRMHPCTFEGCDKSFTRAFNLRSHLNTHNGQRPHRCPEPDCGWDFVRKHDLSRHYQSKHLPNKPYACKRCSSRFGRSDALQRHRRLENHM
ncbi:hypothetical protein KVV02_008187 [Mortierella alpina]|uniref:C2H2-type domain-containing protein n=1 Tax=Mortierella alpina TaxID=64518 RepID=A0A9P8A3U5_MORAP|nr:hypothetical protein KVV02_008187 [Mortierella alpina]